MTDGENRQDLAISSHTPGAYPADARKPRGRARLRALLGRFKSSRNGATAIEFGLVAMPFFIILFSILETGLLFVGSLTLENAVRESARLVRTGYVFQKGLTASGFRDELCTRTMFFTCSNLQVDLKSYTRYEDIPLSAPVKNGKLDTSGFSYTPGGSEQIMALRVYYEWPILTAILAKTSSSLANGNYLLAATTGFRNEPF